MEKEKNSTAGPLFRELLSLNVYKRSQGRIARQATFAALYLTIAIGAWRLSDFAIGMGPLWHFVVPGLLLVVGLWVCFRIVCYPKFADFLIAVEAEMNKVSWPSRSELVRSSVVVLVTIFFLALVLFAYDVFWEQCLTWLKIRVAGGGN
jgi:preprotein translocase subunit SecE